MKEQYEARMLRIHFGEVDKWHGKPLYEAIVNQCRELEIAGATVYRGIEGFGASTTIHHSSIWAFSKDAPIMVSIIDTEDAIQKLIPFLDEMVAEGLVAMSCVQVIRYSKSPSGSAPATH
jgi:PII-like signaling protein